MQEYKLPIPLFCQSTQSCMKADCAVLRKHSLHTKERRDNSMNEKKNLLPQSLCILITAVVIILALFSGKLSHILLAAAIAAWLLRMLFLMLKRRGKLPQSILPCKIPLHRQVKMESAAAQSGDQPSVQTAESTTDRPVLDEQLMLRHISNRISEKLHSAYPEATWQYRSEPSLSHILNGGTVRIVTENTDAYTHADIWFDKYAKIRIEMLVVGEFASSSPQAPAPGTEEPAVVDVETWYNLIGQKVLDSVITDLNAKGHKRLSILENGDIVTGNGKKKNLVDTLENFPVKNYWKELLEILADNDLTGTINQDQLVVAWK